MNPGGARRMLYRRPLSCKVAMDRSHHFITSCRVWVSPGSCVAGVSKDVSAEALGPRWWRGVAWRRETLCSQVGEKVRGTAPDAGACRAPHLPEVLSLFTTARLAGAGSLAADGPPPCVSPAGCVSVLCYFSC